MEYIAEQDVRLDVFLKERGGAHSRMFWQGIIGEGSVAVNGKIITKSSLHLKKGDRVVIMKEIPEVVPDAALESDPSIEFEIVYEDENIAVINKPAGLMVHPTAGHREGTLVNGLLARYPEIRGVGDDRLRPGIVHRLDKDTSGLMVIAKTQEAFLFLKGQFSNREVKKTYIALVEGVPQKLFGTISYPIRSSTQNHFKKVAIKGIAARLTVGGGREAETEYKVLETFQEKYALLEVHPRTGRTHQIRVHLAAIGNPVVGDILYGSKSGMSSRQFLHATKIEFIAPSGKELSFSAPLPEDLEEMLSIIKSANP